MKTVLVSVLLKEKLNPKEVKVSLRSKGEVNINAVARVFNGGGHRNASGCTIPGDVKTVEKAVLTEVKKVL